MAKELVDHSFDLARKADNKLEVAEKAHVKANKKLKKTLAQLSKVKRVQKNTELALC